ncbi:SDR family oxidoreductase [Actinopolymorpha alba]|uniref:SDR family oxidoreductase n=1 Tax=Actinopolymorpha alba TaxID=533267 RepID=UPI00035FB144|nr:SDR family oxidoreductase [Actinopolymorpha alba]
MAALDGKAAVVTGGSRGIGRAIVERLARDGARVVFSFIRDEVSANEVVQAVRVAGGEAYAVRVDLGSVADVRRLFDDTDELLGGLDILVNNAAMSRLRPLAEATEDDYDTVMGANARGTFVALQEAARRMRDGGRIVTISTLNTMIPAPNNGLYQGSKAAVELFTRTAAKELAVRGITANIVSPGATDTDLLRATNAPEMLALIPSMTPLGRLGQPSDIADVVAFLAGPDSAWVTGQNLNATGGFP